MHRAALAQLKERQFYIPPQAEKLVQKKLSLQTEKPIKIEKNNKLLHKIRSKEKEEESIEQQLRDPGLDTLDDIRANIMQMSVLEKLHKAVSKPSKGKIPSSSHDKFPAFTFNSFDPLQEIISAARNEILVDVQSGEKVVDNHINEVEEENEANNVNWKLPLQQEEKEEKERSGIVLSTNLKVFPKKENEASEKIESSFPSGFPQFFGGSDDSQTIREQNLSIEKTTMMETCPSTCTCVCPSSTDSNVISFNEDQSKSASWTSTSNHDMGDGTKKKLDLDISLYPCARSAGYQLNIALKMCKRKKSLDKS